MVGERTIIFVNAERIDGRSVGVAIEHVKGSERRCIAVSSLVDCQGRDNCRNYEVIEKMHDEGEFG